MKGDIITDFNYNDQKKGWVTFKEGRRKVKLRAYIKGLAEKLTAFNEANYKTNRQLLIDCYNKDGVKGIHFAVKVKLAQIIEANDKKHIAVYKNIGKITTEELGRQLGERLPGANEKYKK